MLSNCTSGGLTQGSARLYHGAENEGPTLPYPRDRPSAYEKATADLASVAGLLQRRRGRRPPFAFLWRRPGEILPSGDAKSGPATDIGPPRLPTEVPLAGPFEVGIKSLENRSSGEVRGARWRP